MTLCFKYVWLRTSLPLEAEFEPHIFFSKTGSLCWKLEKLCFELKTASFKVAGPIWSECLLAALFHVTLHIQHGDDPGVDPETHWRDYRSHLTYETFQSRRRCWKAVFYLGKHNIWTTLFSLLPLAATALYLEGMVRWMHHPWGEIDWFPGSFYFSKWNLQTKTELSFKNWILIICGYPLIFTASSPFLFFRLVFWLQNFFFFKIVIIHVKLCILRRFS